MTVTARIRPIVSVRVPRFLPTIFLAASDTWLVRGTLVEVFNALGVEDGGGGLGFASLLYAGEAGEVVVELGEDSFDPEQLHRLRMVDGLRRPVKNSNQNS
ncbi:hypothetical protein Sviol_47900 [Streptomyces violascens]|uniref:Uncharacterized protein n=1 Tax=Streptomyces violascens TaxID=67381 RepID=A0ABQ3QT15_9ACTN|nr:hypothetical protein Sviol_47900 [Streptomyces violascens]